MASQRTLKFRGKNWSDVEKLALINAVSQRLDILFGGRSSLLSKNKKNDAWDEVTAAVNSVSPQTRSLIQTIKKWKELKNEAIKMYAENNNQDGSEVEISPRIICTTMCSFLQPKDKLSNGTKDETKLNLENLASSSKGLNPPKAKALGEQQQKEIPSTLAASLNQSPKMYTNNRHKEGLDLPKSFPVYQTSTISNERKRCYIQTPTEQMLQRQVDLLEKQFESIKDCGSILNYRCEIEEKRLKIEEEKLEVLKQIRDIQSFQIDLKRKKYQL